MLMTLSSNPNDTFLHTCKIRLYREDNSKIQQLAHLIRLLCYIGRPDQAHD